MMQPAVITPRTAWRDGGMHAGERTLPEETAIALVHDGSTTAVMMATPADLEDLACGFAFTEGLITNRADVARAQIVTLPDGVEARLWLARGPSVALLERQRGLVGPTGCGLCGIDSLRAALKPPRTVGDMAMTVSAAQILDAMAGVETLQALGGRTRAVHAAAFWTAEAGITALREDVGRHNALDKLAGALVREGRSASGGAVLLTSRVSVEMVQKAAALGAPLIVAVSAPTALAVRTAEAAGITLVAVARRDGFEVFTHPQRVKA